MRGEKSCSFRCNQVGKSCEWEKLLRSFNVQIKLRTLKSTKKCHHTKWKKVLIRSVVALCFSALSISLLHRTIHNSSALKLCCLCIYLADENPTWRLWEPLFEMFFLLFAQISPHAMYLWIKFIKTIHEKWIKGKKSFSSFRIGIKWNFRRKFSRKTSTMRNYHSPRRQWHNFWDASWVVLRRDKRRKMKTSKQILESRVFDSVNIYYKFPRFFACLHRKTRSHGIKTFAQFHVIPVFLLPRKPRKKQKQEKKSSAPANVLREHSLQFDKCSRRVKTQRQQRFHKKIYKNQIHIHAYKQFSCFLLCCYPTV